MTKEELIKDVQESLQDTPCRNFGKEDIKTVIDHAIEAIIASVRGGEKVTLRGFGTFKTVERKAKTARNIAKGTAITIPARKCVTFKPAKEFRTVED